MIEFVKDVRKILPYDREQYINFLTDEGESSVAWYGVSFQINSKIKKNDLTEFVENYEPLFKKVILELDNGSSWIVNHDDKDLKWFPNDENTLIALRVLFQQKNIPYTFKGALMFKKNDLLEYSKNLISYPYSISNEDNLLYKNLDVSHGELQFIIKISGHLNVDFLSTDKELLRKIVNENASNVFNIKEYRGTSL